jgi:hypothetical protein
MASQQRTFESETLDQRKKRLNNEHQAYYRKRQKLNMQNDMNLEEWIRFVLYIIFHI